ncbi:MAG: YbjN domain-containing protein, partial [Bdellovibrionales bacterium]
MTNTAYLNEQCNPLDAAEEFLTSQKWDFDRLEEDQLYFSIEGDRGQYKLFFMWDDTQDALQFCCEIDLCMPKTRVAEVHKMLAEVNSQMWLGHFDVSTDEKSGCIAPCFRYTTLLRGMDYASCIHLAKDLIKVTLQECERIHDAFHVLDRKSSLAIVESAIAASTVSASTITTPAVAATPLATATIAAAHA